MAVEYRDPPVSYLKMNNERRISQVHYHYQHELYYLVSGETKYFVGDDIFHLQPGDFIFVPRLVIHKTDSENCMYNERILLSFEDEILDDSFRPVLQELSDCKLIHIPTAKAYIVEELLRKLQTEVNQGDRYNDVMVKLYILELLTQLCRLKYDFVPQISDSEKLIHTVAAYIRTNFAQDLSLQSLSRRFALSESCLSRKFKAVSGMGLSEYITSVRIHNAEQLLTGIELSVTEVAELCGYSDSNYFASVFKKIKGTTPAKYARSLRNHAQQESGS